MAAPRIGPLTWEVARPSEPPGTGEGVWSIIPTGCLCVGLVLSVFSGFWPNIGSPLPLDRIFFAGGFVLLCLGFDGWVGWRRWRWRSVYGVMAATAAYASLSALMTGSLTTADGFFALLDRLGVVPFLLVLVVPVAFGTRRQRDMLLATLVFVGAYLGFTAIAEGLNVKALVYPRYIIDPHVGIHYGRTRGPFGEAVANGLGLYACAVASAIAVYQWKRQWTRMIAGAVCVACLAGTIFTVTRAVWLGATLGTVIGMMCERRLRRSLLVFIPLGAVAVAILLLAVPGLSGKATSRLGAQGPVWDRLNTDLAAVRMVEQRPFQGWGWQRFTHSDTKFLRQSANYPLTGWNAEVHNVFLSHLVELGLIGTALWLWAFLLTIVAPMLRRGPPDIDPWRIGLIAITIMWLVAAMFGPVSYAFPNALIWLWGGVVIVGAEQWSLADVRRLVPAARRTQLDLANVPD
jgi:putative inorganic carbon (hco3(-)) transporter